MPHPLLPPWSPSQRWLRGHLLDAGLPSLLDFSERHHVAFGSGPPAARDLRLTLCIGDVPSLEHRHNPSGRNGLPATLGRHHGKRGQSLLYPPRLAPIARLVTLESAVQTQRGEGVTFRGQGHE